MEHIWYISGSSRGHFDLEIERQGIALRKEYYEISLGRVQSDTVRF